MKKLRLISFMLAFVMVVAMMVPALAVLVAADGDTLPAGDTLAAWNVGWPNGSINAGAEATVDAHDNPNKDAAWAGAAYQLQALKTTATEFGHANATMVTEYKVGAIDGDNVYGFMLDVVANGSNNNSAMIFIVEVDGVAYYNIGKITVDANAETPVYTGPATYFVGANGWTIVSNVCEEFTGAPAASAYQRAVRLPKNYNGKLFIPLESLVATYAGSAAAYNSEVVADAEALTAEKLASAAAVKVYALGTWNAPEGMFQGASIVYSTDWVAPIAAPTTLPGADTAEWTGHAGYGAAGLQNFPAAFSLNTALVGKAFEVSDNLLAEPIVTPEGGGDQFANADVTAVPADANLAGLLLKVSVGGTSANNGTMFGFTANGNRYAVANNFNGMNAGVKMAVLNPVYLYDGVAETWTWYRDNYSHCTLRTPAGATTWVFIPLDAIRVNTAAAGARPAVDLAYGNAAADLITAGISNVEFSKSWGDQVTLSEVQYVYVEGYDSQKASVMPGAAVTGFNLGFSSANGTPAIGTDRDSLGNIDSFDYAAAWAGASVKEMAAATKLETVIQEKFKSSYKYELPANVSGDDIVGFKLAYANESLQTYNVAVVLQLKVDDVVYYSISYNEQSLVYYTWANSDKWYAASNLHMPFSGQVEGQYERATRLPAGLAGDLFVPVESFYTAFDGGLDGYNGTKPETETQLTSEILAAATSIELYASTTWGDGVFADGAVITKGMFVNYAPEGDKPTTLPNKDDIAFRTDYDAYFVDTDLVADNAVTPTDAMWGADFVATGAAVEDVTGAVWADLAGILLTVNNTDKAAASVALNFTYDTHNYNFNTLYGHGAKPIYLWQGGDKWIVEGAAGYKDSKSNNAGSFTVPAGYVGYIYIPVTALTSNSVVWNNQFNADVAATTQVLFSDFVNEIGNTFSYTGLTINGVEATAELLWVKDLGATFNNGDAEKPATFPNINETPIIGYGSTFATAYNGPVVEGRETEAFMNTFVPFTAWGTSAEPNGIGANATAIKADRTLSSKFSGSTMITESLISEANGGLVRKGADLTMTVDGTPAINAATAVGLLFKINMPVPYAPGVGLDFAITVGGNEYYFFNKADHSVWEGSNGLLYMYNDNTAYGEAAWTSTYGDGKIRVQGSFDGYVLVPFNLLKNGSEALDMNLVASAGITDVKVRSLWDDSPLYIEGVEVASVPATLANSSVTIGNDITLNVNAIVTGTPTSVKANFIIGENTVTVDGVAGENGFYNFALTGIGAHTMMDKIDIELVVDDAIVSRVDDYTIAEYVAKVLRSSDESKVKKVAADLLYYGDAVQTLLGYNADNLATSVLATEELDNRSNNMINRIKDEVEIAGAISDNVQWKGATVLPVDGGLSIVFKAVVIDATDVAIAVKKGEATETFTADKWGVVDNEYIVVFNNIAITELGTVLTANFVKGTANEGATLTASTEAILAAIADKNSGATAAEKELAICLYALSNSLANYAK